MAISSQMDNHLKNNHGATAYTVSGAQATVPSANLSQLELQRIMDVAAASGYQVVLAAGVLTIKPR